jgi:hypothetical protein
LLSRSDSRQPPGTRRLAGRVADDVGRLGLNHLLVGTFLIVLALGGRSVSPSASFSAKTKEHNSGRFIRLSCDNSAVASSGCSKRPCGAFVDDQPACDLTDTLIEAIDESTSVVGVQCAIRYGYGGGYFSPAPKHCREWEGQSGASPDTSHSSVKPRLKGDVYAFPNCPILDER